LIATGEFDARVVKVTSAGVDADYGRRHNEVRLYDNGVLREGGGGEYAHTYHSYSVEWDAGSIDGATIGIITDGRQSKRVVDYDGVFDIPREIRKFLEHEGFDLSEV
jgi:hypothetical protein